MKINNVTISLLTAVFFCGVCVPIQTWGSDSSIPDCVAKVAKDSVALVPVDKCKESWWKARYENQAKRLAQGKVDLLMIGDSITHGWEGAGKDVWNKYYANRNAANFGISADRTEHVIWRLLHSPLDKISPKLAVVMIGTNNIGHGSSTPVETVAGICKIVSILKEKCPGTQILLLEVFPRSHKPDNPLRIKVNEINKLLRQTFAKSPGVTLMSLEGKYLEKNGILPPEIMPDFLHPNGKGYEIWAQAMEPIIVKALGEKVESESSTLPVECKGVPRSAKWWTNRFEAKNELLKKGNIDILMIGDSITHGWEGAGKDVWDKYYGGKKAINLGIGGDQTQHVIWRLEHYDFSNVNPKLAVVLIGINNWASSTAENIALGNRRICEILHAKFPKMKIFVLNVFPYGKKGEVNKHEKVAAINKSINEALKDVEYVKVININHVFLDKNGDLPKEIMPDYLHPNAVGYEKWGAALDSPISQAL